MGRGEGWGCNCSTVPSSTFPSQLTPSAYLWLLHFLKVIDIHVFEHHLYCHGNAAKHSKILCSPIRQQLKGWGMLYSRLTIIIFIHFILISTTTITWVCIIYISPNCSRWIHLEFIYSHQRIIFWRGCSSPALSTFPLGTIVENPFN